MTRPHRLSKSRFTSGRQCLRQLWWRVHEPGAPELVPDAATQALYDQGHEVGAVARGYVPGGTLVDLPWRDYDGRVAATRAAMAAGAPAVYEASFVADDVFVAVDILAREGAGWRVIEVKSSTTVKEQHYADVAIQAHVLRASAVPLAGVDVMVLNRACTYPELGDLFRREDVTPVVERLLPGIPGEVRTQVAVLEGPLPDVAPGPHCTSPYECPFLARCNPELPEHHVRTLYRMHHRQLVEFEERGWASIHDLPEGVITNPQADRQRRAVQSGRLVVDGDLAAALAAFQGPLAYLDFETVMPPIPRWNGCHPYDQVPAQFSCHVERPDGSLAHHAWLADGPGDPRPAIARAVVEACAGARTVVAYSMGFEKRCLESLAAAVPELADALGDVVRRLADPLLVMREHVYHPDFGGGFGLKAVLPALVPDLSYDGLEIAAGDVATRALATLMFDAASLPPGGRERLRAALLAYCERDTRAMVGLMARLRELAGV